MANIYSEVGRTFIAQKAGDTERERSALTRALDLFDATSDALLASNSRARLKEVQRSKEQFLQAYSDGQEEDKSSIERYFMQYALAARSAS